jgi:hypothetical protein
MTREEKEKQIEELARQIAELSCRNMDDYIAAMREDDSPSIDDSDPYREQKLELFRQADAIIAEKGE